MPLALPTAQSLPASAFSVDPRLALLVLALDPADRAAEQLLEALDGAHDDEVDGLVDRLADLLDDLADLLA